MLTGTKIVIFASPAMHRAWPGPFPDKKPALMLTEIHPKLPMRDKAATRAFYTGQLGFEDCGREDYEGYLMLRKDGIQLHFFEHRNLDPLENYGQVYIRTDNIDEWYRFVQERQLPMPRAGRLEDKPWGQREFSLLDPDHNLLTFGQPA